MTAINGAAASTDAICPPSAEDQELAGTARDEIQIPVVAEELQATVRPGQGIPVRVQRRIVREAERTESLASADEIFVSRRIVSRQAPNGEPVPFEQIIIELPLPAGVTADDLAAGDGEEIVVTHEIVQRTERIAGRVRREEVTVTTSGDIERMEGD